MIARPLRMEGLFLLEPELHIDDRGHFYESFNQKEFDDLIGCKIIFVQDNHVKSAVNVLRGLHFQLPPKCQGKLVRVLYGEIMDVVVDIRANSTTFGEWLGVNLSSDNRSQLWIPEGFAHGYKVISKSAEVFYKTTDYYEPKLEQILRWDDERLQIKWGMGEPIVSQKDKKGKAFSDSEYL